MGISINDPVGVIDIGSNSVRLVVYHALHRVPLPLFNEKHLCGLGASLRETGALDVEGKEETRRAVQRYATLAKRRRVSALHVIATAALRDASDGPAFQTELEKLLGKPIRVLSGKEEAELALLGIRSSFAAPQGLVADLGGGSLELGVLKKEKNKPITSAPLGVLRTDAAQSAKELLKTHTQYDGQHEMLYAVGGSFRALAKMHLRSSSYPLPLLHGYQLAAKQVHEIATRLAALSDEEIAGLPGIPARRAPHMRYASDLLHSLMQRYHCRHVRFSVSGIREGYLHSLLDTEIASQDPLIASAADLALFAERHGRYASELRAWAAPLFATMPERWERLRHAACLLSEIAWRIDPNFRGVWLYCRVLQSSLKRLSHRERVMLALALYHRHESKWKEETGPLTLLDERDRLWARAVGLSLRLAAEITGGASGYLPATQITYEDARLELLLDEANQPLRSATVQKYSDGLGETLSALSNLA